MNKHCRFTDGGISAVAGIQTAGIHSGIKKMKKDIALIVSDKKAAAAGVFTKNKVKAPPVLATMENLKKAGGYGRAIIVNSGNANACTGDQGLRDAQNMIKATAENLQMPEQEVLVSSTGVIGVQLPMDIVLPGIKTACQALGYNNSHDTAISIMTTDTYPKETAVETMIDGQKITIGGIAKGSGMIHPNMATMLAFIASDVSITPSLLQAALKDVVEETFNMISVDGDTSTNDMVLVLANGYANNQQITKKNEDYQSFKEALHLLCYKLAELVVRDGEGATKFVTVKVNNAGSLKDARSAARTITTSSLVKTAVFGEDANWGRVIMAIGNSEADFDPDKVDIYLESSCGREQMMQDGMGLVFNEEKAKEILSEKDIIYTVDLKMGNYAATAWTCDLSYEYVRINADYRS